MTLSLAGFGGLLVVTLGDDVERLQGDLGPGLLLFEGPAPPVVRLFAAAELRG